MMYIPTPPAEPDGIVYRSEVYCTEFLASAQNMIRARYPLDVKEANEASPVVDWKVDWITNIDPEVDLA